MKDRQLTAEDVRKALAAQNVEQPGGKVDSGRTESGFRVTGRIARPADFEEVVIDTRTGAFLRRA